MLKSPATDEIRFHASARHISWQCIRRFMAVQVLFPLEGLQIGKTLVALGRYGDAFHLDQPAGAADGSADNHMG